ncbi:hypothetical protein [Bythopirellula goksoeyrii]|uniref:hypothetical protein n=1 Tax=Bythopirellula goksoeyrii TaxID=1400387 RepID=UPI0011CE2796|nr:hypothetical protein [Bythopirellula goksoeyrii]
MDTITNAFGGILFLALLVVVLLQNTSKVHEDVPNISQATLSELRSTLQDIEAKVSSLNLEVEAREAIASNLADPTLESTLSKLAALRQSKSELIRDKSSILETISRLQGQLNSLDEKGELLEAEIEELGSALEITQKSLEEERARRKINSPFPEEKASSKAHIPATVRYGRWYLSRDPDGEFNLDDFVVLDNSGKYLTITPKPYRGIPIVQGGKLSKRLLEYLSKQNPASKHIEISIWDDSYLEFQHLRDYLVERGFEYRLIAVSQGDEVVEGYVPNPQVQ